MTPVMRLAALAGLALALTGCVRLTSDTTLGEDDTLTQHAVIAATEGALSTFSRQLGDLPLPEGADVPDDPALLDLDTLLDPAAIEEQLAPLEEAYPGSVDVLPYADDDGLEGVEITVTDIPLDALADASATTPLAGGTSIVREDGSYVVTLESGAASQLEAAGADASQLRIIENAVDIAVSFTFPGLVTEATAGEVAGNTVTLGLSDLLSQDTVRIVGGADARTDWGPFLRWGLVALAAIIVVGGATALVIQDRRRRTRTTLPPPRASGGAAAGTLPRDDAPEA